MSEEWKGEEVNSGEGCSIRSIRKGLRRLMADGCSEADLFYSRGGLSIKED